MQTPVIFIPGTHGAKGYTNTNWWRYNSRNAATFRAWGIEVYPFQWTTNLDGLIGSNNEWRQAGYKLAKWQQEFWQTIGAYNVIASSHGGQVLAYAAQNGFKAKRGFTLGTPVRSDVDYSPLSLNCESWTHVYGTRDWFWQQVGSIGDKEFNWFRRKMPLATHNLKYHGGHTSMCESESWHELGIYASIILDKDI